MMTMTTPDEICERLDYIAAILEANAHKFTVPDHIPAKVKTLRFAKATIERLSAALEDAVALIEKQLRQKASAAWDHEAKAFLAALGKDARDLRAREEDRG